MKAQLPKASDPRPLEYADDAEFRAVRREWEAVVQCDKLIHTTSRLVLLHMSTFFGADAFAWPSAETVAADLGISEKQTYRALRDGRGRGWLLPLGRRGFGGSMRYRLSADADTETSIRNRLAGERLIREMRRDHPAPKAPSPTNGDAGVPIEHLGHSRPMDEVTGVLSLGTPASDDPIPPNLSIEPSKRRVGEKGLLVPHCTSATPGAAHTSDRAARGPLAPTTELLATPIFVALRAGKIGEFPDTQKRDG